MGVMKRAAEARLYGGALSKGFKVAFGFEPEPPSEEEAKALRDAAREARAERAAIQAVEREAEEERTRVDAATVPVEFMGPAPDFPRGDDWERRSQRMMFG